MSFEIHGNFRVNGGTYANLQPFYLEKFDSLKGELFYIFGRKSGMTEAAYLEVNSTFSGEKVGYLHVKPQLDSDCVGEVSIEVYITEDLERYRELVLQAILEGMKNIYDWIMAGSGS